MKKILLIIFSCLVLTGCLDIVQYISIDGNQIHMSLRYAIQKMVFEMASSFSEETVDYDEMSLVGEDVKEMFGDTLVEARDINTATEIGVEMIVNTQLNSPSDSWYPEDVKNRIPFLPYKIGDHYEIFIDSLSEESNEDLSIGLGLLASSKYRIMVNKTDDFKDISGFEILPIDGAELSFEEYDLDLGFEDMVYDYGSIIVFELPVIFLFANPEGFIIRLI